MSLPSIGDLVRDERVSLVRARVELHEGESIHYETSAEGHITLSTKTINHAVPIHATMKGGGDDGSGTWAIPPIGTELLLGFDDGDFEGDAFVVQVFGNQPPSGLAQGKCFVIGDEVEVRSQNGTAVSLMTKADGEKFTSYLRKQFDPIAGHTHTSAPPGDPTVGVLEGAAGSGVTTVPSPDGTSVLKGE